MSGWSKKTPKRHHKTSKSAVKKYKSSRGYGKSLSLYTRSSTSVPIMYNPMQPRVHNVVAPRFLTNLEYGFTGFLAANVGYHFTVAGNGLSLPGNTANLFTGAGGTLFPATHALNALQPTGFAQLAALYNSYRVWTSTVTVGLYPVLNTDAQYVSGAAMGVIFPTNTENTLADVQKAQSLPYSVVKTLTSSGNNHDNTISLTMDTKSVYGLSIAQQQADPAFSSLTGANPSNTWWYNVLLSNTRNHNMDCSVVLRVNYRVEFYDPNESGIADI